MAACAHEQTVSDTTQAATYASASFTPAADDLLVVCGIATATITAAPTLTDSQALGFTRADAQLWGATSQHQSFIFVADDLAAASAMTVTLDVTGDNATGAAYFVAAVSGMDRVGADAVVQVSSTPGSNAVPATTFGAAVTTTNPTIVCAGHGTNSTATEPTGWTERGDTTYLTPNTGASYATRNSGFTGTTVTWGSSLADQWVALAIELDASAQSAAGGAIQVKVADVFVPATPKFKDGGVFS
jgi:hypothetical protein